MLTVPLLALLGACDPAVLPAQPEQEAERRRKHMFYLDADGDGFGDTGSVWIAHHPPPGYALVGGDCDDGNAAVNPGAPELCDGIDDDCDVLVDEEGGQSWYSDLDGDGFGDPASASPACAAPAGWVANGGDCDPNSAIVHPGAIDACGDGVDADCDGVDPGCRWTGDLTAVDAVFALNGVDMEDAGSTVAYAGDVDGDGRDDLLVGAHYGATRAGAGQDGRVYVIYGGVLPSGAADTTSEPWLEAEPGNYLYGSLSTESAGDIDGDGLDDFLFGTPSYADGGGPTADPGAAWLVYGSSARLVGSAGIASVAGASFTGVDLEEGVGYTVGRAGDLDLDGFGEFAVSSAERSEIYVFDGNPSRYAGARAANTANATLTSGAQLYPGGRGGIAGADIDGDGADDLLVSATSSDGRIGCVDVLYGAPGGLTGSAPLDASADATFEAPTSGFAAVDVAGAGDVDGDGTADLLIAVGYAQADSTAASFLLVGGPTRWSGTLEEADARATFLGAAGVDYGDAAVSAGDADGDGFSDVAVASGWTSRTSLFYGGSLAGPYDVVTGSDARFVGAGGCDQSAVALAGDLDADGHSDLWIADRFADGEHGGAWLFPGSAN